MIRIYKTDRAADVQSFGKHEPLNVLRYRVAEEAEHLANREGDSHPVRTVGVAHHETP